MDGDGDPHMRPAELRIDLFIVACAISAGIHGALVRDHFEESTGAGLGFVAATVLLAVLAVVLTRKPTQLALVATGAIFAGLIAGYALVITTGFPVLHPSRKRSTGSRSWPRRSKQSASFLRRACCDARRLFSPSRNRKEH